ncbi:hypothetical protein KC887_02695 [Candidatus Kaiserbacteria bacterium]|nr:hypothetical protein [Candidatus Kaiserbacteria bacterium]
MRPVTLICSAPPLVGTGEVDVSRLNAAARQYKRSIRRVGGYWIADFWIYPSQAAPEAYLREWFENRLGFGFREKLGGVITWDGVIWTMELALDGHKEKKDLGDVYNAVRTDYLDTDQAPQSTAWFTNAGSIAQYGRREEILYEDEIDATAAAAAAQDELLRQGDSFAQTVAIGSQVNQDGLHVTAVGRVVTANNRYITVDDGTTGNISDFVSDIIDTDCDFLKVGRIQTNTLQKKRTFNEPKRGWDAIVELLRLGDGTNPWVFYVDSDGYAHYEAASNIPRYEWRGRDGGLVGRLGNQTFWEFWPGVIRNTKRTPTTPAPGTFLADGRDSWVMEVEMGDGFAEASLKPDGIDPEEIARAVEINKQQLLEDAKEKSTQSGGA